MPTVKEKISIRQFIILTVIFTMGSSVLNGTTMLVRLAHQDAWLASIIGIIYGVLLVLLYGLLTQRHPNLNLADYIDKVLGKWFGTLMKLSFSIYTLLLSSALLRTLGDFLTTLILPETPIQAVEIVFMLTLIMGVQLGLETFTRTSEFLFPFIMSFIILIALFLLPQMKLVDNLSPVLENGITPILSASYRLLGIPFAELILLLMITPHITNRKKIRKSMLLGVLGGGIVLVIINVLSIAVLGADATAGLSYPTYELAKEISIGNFIQRIEVLAGGIIFISLFVKSIIVFYVMIVMVTHTFHVSNYRIITLPLGMLVMVLSIIIFPNVIYFRNLAFVFWPTFTLLHGLIYPVLLLGIDSFRRRLNKTKASLEK